MASIVDRPAVKPDCNFETGCRYKNKQITNVVHRGRNRGRAGGGPVPSLFGRGLGIAGAPTFLVF